MERLATHTGPGHVGHDGLDLGLFDKGQCGRQSQQALSAAVMATLVPNPEQEWGSTLVTPWLQLFVSH